MLQLFRPKYEVEECLTELRKVLESGWTGVGPRCAELEKKWSEKTGAVHSHFVNSATAALHIAVRLCDLPPASKIATTGITFISTNSVIRYEGHTPVFCDVNPHTMSLSWQSAIKAVEEGCAAVMWVHYGGSVAPDFYTFMDEMKKRGLNAKVIEDCAHCDGSFYADGTRVGSRKDTIACFSFQAVKNMPTFDSGMICVPDDALHKRATQLSWLGIDKSTYERTNVGGSNEVYKWMYTVPELGWKYNGNDIAATVGLVQLKYLDRDNAYRKQLYEWYCDALGDCVKILKHEKGSSHHLMVVQSDKRDQIMSALKSNQLAPGVHYQPNFEFPVLAPFYQKGACPAAEHSAKRIVSLPNHLCMGIEDVTRICSIIRDVQ